MVGAPIAPEYFPAGHFAHAKDSESRSDGNRFDFPNCPAAQRLQLLMEPLDSGVYWPVMHSVHILCPYALTNPTGQFEQSRIVVFRYLPALHF